MNKEINKISMLLLLVLSLLSSCMSNLDTETATTNSDIVSSKSYSGCVSATALSSTKIKVVYNFPLEASEVIIYRNGSPLSSFATPSVTTFTDDGLVEGEEYTYKCFARIDGKVADGATSVTETTIAVNAPVFNGIVNAVALTPTTAYLSWSASTGGAVVSYFNVYSTRGTTTNFSTIKVQESNSTYSSIISNLSDEMDYAFSVRACNASDICDTNIVTRTITTADKGIPTSIGATSILLDDGKAKFVVPWIEEYGAVAKRNIYRANVNDVATILATKILSPPVTDITTPETAVEDASILEGFDYYYIIRDEDPAGNENLNTTILSLSIGDLSPPNLFNGLVSVATTAPDESKVRLTFNTMTHQPADNSGATSYLVYKTEATHPAAPADACATGTLTHTLPASGFTPSAAGVTFDIDSHVSRRNYAYCMKAQDAALNISNTTLNRTITMPDLTAPVFDGLQTLAYDAGTDKFVMGWNTATSALSDTSYYRVKIWKNTPTPSGGDITTKTYPHGSSLTGAEFNSTDFSYTDGDTVYVLVDACDDANSSGSAFNTIDNCTSYALADHKLKSLDDTTAPSPWNGISTLTNISEGVIRVQWSFPADRSDFAAFKFYHIEETSMGVFSKTLIDQASCTASDCLTNPKVEHYITGLRKNHNYRIYVSAVDTSSNETGSLTSNSSLTHSDIITLDTSAPTFSSNLSLNQNGAMDLLELNWDTANDNQHAQVDYLNPNIIKYSVYRKDGVTTFQPADYISGVPNTGISTISILAQDLTVTNFSETLSALTQGQTYHYIACAYDMIGNTKCDTIQSTTITDNVLPVVVATIDENPNSTNWTLDITANDGPKPPTEVTVVVFRKFSDNPADFPGTSGGQFGSPLSGEGTIGTPTQFVFGTDAITNDGSTNHYANYTIQATDGSANTSLTYLSHLIRAPSFTSTLIEHAPLLAGCIEDTTCVGENVSGAHADVRGVSAGLGLSSANTLAYVLTAPTNGTITNCFGLNSSAYNDSNCDYTPTTLDFFGTDTFTICLSDNVVTLGLGDVGILNSCKTIDVAVAGVNDPARYAVGDFTYMTDNLGSINLLENIIDVDGTGETFEITAVSFTSTTPDTLSFTAPSGGDLTAAITSSSSDAAAEKFTLAVGTHSISYTVLDSNGASSTHTTAKLNLFSPYMWTGATNTNFFSGLNYCGSLSATMDGVCQNNASTPSSSSNIVFGSNTHCGANCNPILNSEETINHLLSTVEYTGKFTAAAASVLYVNKSIVFTSGELDFTAATKVEAFRVTIDDAGILRAPATFTIKPVIAGTQVLNAFEMNGGTFIHNNGLVDFKGNNTLAQTLEIHLNADTDITFYNLSMHGSHGSERLYTTGPSITIENDLDINVGGHNASGGGAFKLWGNFIGGYSHPGTEYSGGLSGSPIYFVNSSGLQTITIAPGAVPADVGVMDGGVLNIPETNYELGTVHIVNGTFNAPTGTLTLNKFHLDTSSGGTQTFTHNNGKVLITGIYENQVFADDPVHFYDFEIASSVADATYLNRISGRINVLNNLYLNDLSEKGHPLYSEHQDPLLDTIDVYGDITLNKSNSEFIYNKFISIRIRGSGNQTITGTSSTTSTLRNLHIEKTGGTLTLLGPINNYGNLTYVSGTVVPGTSTFYQSTRSGGGNTTQYNASINVTGSLPFNNLHILGLGNASTIINSGGVIAVGGDLTLGGIAKLLGGSIEAKKNISFEMGEDITTPITLNGTIDQNISFPGLVHYSGVLTVDNPGNTVTMQDDYKGSGAQIIVNSGTFDFNANVVEAASIQHNVGGTVNFSGGSLLGGFGIDNGGTWNP